MATTRKILLSITLFLITGNGKQCKKVGNASEAAFDRKT